MRTCAHAQRNHSLSIVLEYATFCKSMKKYNGGPTNHISSQSKLQQITARHVKIVFRYVENHVGICYVFAEGAIVLKHCPWDYDDDTEFQLSMKPQDIASLRECVDEHSKLKTKLKTKQSSHPRATSPTCVSRVTWGPTQL